MQKKTVSPEEQQRREREYLDWIRGEGAEIGEQVRRSWIERQSPPSFWSILFFFWDSARPKPSCSH